MPPVDELHRAEIHQIIGSDPERNSKERRPGAADGDGLPGAAAFPPDWEETGRRVEYLYREYSLLVRTPALDRVRDELSLRFVRDFDVPESQLPALIDEVGVIEGVTRLTWPAERGLPTTPTLLDGYDVDSGEATEGREDAEGTEGREAGRVPGLDETLGVRVATPDHVLYLCGHPCPATEPEEVPGSAIPFPAVSTGLCCGTAEDCRPQRVCDGVGVFVSIVDSGLLKEASADHIWLNGVEGDLDDAVVNGQIRHYSCHGTFVAGCVRCTAPKASIYVESTPADHREAETGAAYETDVVLKMGQTLDRGPDIIVCEFNGETRKNIPLVSFDALYESRIRPLKGLVVLVPAGNEGTRVPAWPAAHTWVISVGALSANWRTRASFSNYGGWVDVYAPGEDLVNAFATGGYECIEDPNAGVHRNFTGMAKWSGTSFSTPLVAGLIAARMSATGENAPQAADALLHLARRQALPGVGPVLFPDQPGCDLDPPRPSGCSCHPSPHCQCGRH